MAARILVVEDNEHERRGLVSLLRQHNYQVTEARDGQEASDLLAAEDPPNLILLDMLMPRFDGWRFLSERMANPAYLRVPVLLVTGLNIATEAWAQDVTAAGLLKKPLNVDELLDKVQRLIVQPAQAS